MRGEVVELGGLPVATDVTPGEWLGTALRPIETGSVGSFVPPGFPAYARVLHPAVRYAGDDDLPVRWSQVARFNGRRAHPLMQWPAVTGGFEYLHDADQPELWNDSPPEGHLPVEVAARLAGILARYTGTPAHCWFGRWDGYGFDAGELGDLPRLQLPGRAHLLVAGAVPDAVRNLAPEPHEQSANVWWPADRAWCVATDVDLMSTYVAGSAACIAEVLGAPALESVPASPDDPVGWAADTVNPAPSG